MSLADTVPMVIFAVGVFWRLQMLVSCGLVYGAVFAGSVAVSAWLRCVWTWPDLWALARFLGALIELTFALAATGTLLRIPLRRTLAAYDHLA